jgi:hypothetical protein
MAVVKKLAGTSAKYRLLIGGLSNMGKTTSLSTFLYGPFDYHNPGEQSEAIEYAGQKQGIILCCPSETGEMSLPIETPHIKAYYLECDDSKYARSGQESSEMLSAFNDMYSEALKEKPYYLFIDGIHTLYTHVMNKATDGQWFSGESLDYDPKQGREIAYRGSRFYSRTFQSFDQSLLTFRQSSIPFVICTTQVEWEAAQTDDQRPDVTRKRYYWPRFPGAMATQVVGRFDGYIAAMRNAKCYLGKECPQSKKYSEHHCWQISPQGDYMGLGIKGLKLWDELYKSPWIHQNYDDLKDLLALVKFTG